MALRPREGSKPAHVKELESLIADNRVQMIGPIRQELLSGILNEAQFKTLETHLRAFPDVPLTADDYVTAARFFNLCRAKGIQGSNTDFLICAVAARHRRRYSQLIRTLVCLRNTSRLHCTSNPGLAAATLQHVGPIRDDRQAISALQFRWDGLRTLC